jgi:hypothetical protein
MAPNAHCEYSKIFSNMGWNELKRAFQQTSFLASRRLLIERFHCDLLSEVRELQFELTILDQLLHTLLVDF